MTTLLKLSRNISINLNNIVAIVHRPTWKEIELKTIVKDNDIVIIPDDFPSTSSDIIFDTEAYNTLKDYLDK